MRQKFEAEDAYISHPKVSIHEKGSSTLDRKLMYQQVKNLFALPSNVVNYVPIIRKRTEGRFTSQPRPMYPQTKAPLCRRRWRQSDGAGTKTRSCLSLSAMYPLTKGPFISSPKAAILLSWGGGESPYTRWLKALLSRRRRRQWEISTGP